MQIPHKKKKHLLSRWKSNFFLHINAWSSIEDRKKENYHQREISSIFKVSRHEGTSPCSKSWDKSHRVNWPFLPQNLVAGTKIWSLQLVPQIRNGLNFWDKSLQLVPQNASCELFGGTSPCAKSLPVNSGDWSQGPVPLCVPTFIQVLYTGNTMKITTSVRRICMLTTLLTLAKLEIISRPSTLA